MFRIGQQAPDFKAATTMGSIDFHEWMDRSWVVLLSFPRVSTRVCTSELAKLAIGQAKFATRHVKVIGISADSLEQQAMWVREIEQAVGAQITFPLISDPSCTVILIKKRRITIDDETRRFTRFRFENTLRAPRVVQFISSPADPGAVGSSRNERLA